MTIRKAHIEDMPAILELVKELAEFEKEPDAVITSIKEYEENFTSGLFDAIVAEKDGQVIGMAFYYPIFSTWKGKCLYLEDFVVKNENRNEGVGQKLWDRLIEICKEEGVKQLRWQVLDWNADAIRFYERNQAIIIKDWWNGRVIFNN